MQRTGERYRSRGAFTNKRGGRTRGNVTGPKGLFAQGIWQCNCSPRLPAEHFKVKKEGPNKGRWFYTCQQSEPQRCGFFLWEEEAKPREEAAVLSNTRHEPGSTQEVKAMSSRNSGQSKTSSNVALQESAPVGKGLFAGASFTGARDESPSPSSTQSPTPTARTSKRNAHVAELDTDSEDDFAWALSGQEEAELTKAVDMATPQKAVKMGVYDTPATSARKSARKLPWLQEPTSPTTSRSFDEPLTPSTSSNKKSVVDYFATPSKPPTVSPIDLIEDSDEPKTRSVRVRFAEEPTTPLTATVPSSSPKSLAPPASPSPPTRKKDAFRNPSDARATLTHDVLSALSSAPPLPAEVLAQVRGVLSMHDLRTQGVIMGRDVLRRALQEKDARIAELEAKCVRLESSAALEKSRVDELRWKLREAGVDEEDDDLWESAQSDV